MDNTNYYERNREIMLNRVKNYYENDKERLREQARNKYRYLSEEDKKKKSEYGKNRYHNMFEEKKQELKNIKNKDMKKQKSQRIMNKTVFFNNNLIVHVLFSSILINPYI